jgi:aldehyde:ferredoxin oxidoreductase
MKRFGTAGIVNTTNGRGMLPTRSFQRGHFDEAMTISGEYMEDHELVGVKSSCLHCPVTCGRDVEVDGRRVKGPEYETVALLGSNLEIGDLKKVSEWNFLADDPGMDTINSMVLCIFTTYGMFPAAIHNMDPKSLTHRMLSKAFENSGPMMRMAMGMKGKPMLWFEKWLTYCHGADFLFGSPAGDRRPDL